MTEPNPNLIVVSGPNGAGKSTAAPSLLQDLLEVTEFVNADVIAQGLAAFDPDSVAFEAGSIMHTRLRSLASKRRNFAFETTLASRSLAPWLRELLASHYSFHLVFLWLPSADFAVARVADRVRLGGHNVPEDTIRRRYRRGLRNFFQLYQPLATAWRVYDNSHESGIRLIAAGAGTNVTRMGDEETWTHLQREYGHEH
ncbi:MAG: AAA family ATPase [Planctomycetota bacterium]|nr:AAA family ATPase [Planctomycetota bacterium]